MHSNTIGKVNNKPLPGASVSLVPLAIYAWRKRPLVPSPVCHSEPLILPKKRATPN